MGQQKGVPQPWHPKIGNTKLFQLFFAFFGDCVSCAKSNEDGDAAAEGSVLVARFAVSGQIGREDSVSVQTRILGLLRSGLSLTKETAAVGVGSHA